MVPIAPSHSTVPPAKSLSTAAAIRLLSHQVVE
jgi:hypothetical protein